MNSDSTTGTLPEGYQLHWYEFRSILGRGGYGITYLALDKNLDRMVAIKEYLPNDFATRKTDQTVEPLSGQQGELFNWGLNSFLKEAKTLAKFNHPNIVRVVSVFEHNNTAYMVMEYEQGDDLSKLYRKNFASFDEARLLDTFVPILDGLALVHQEGFIHRDIKPANIFIRHDESPVLLDFGSARQTVGNQTQTLTSLVTYGYAPFEQYNEGGGKQGPWTDIYALGATIYFGIVGRKPEDALNRGGFFINNQSDPYEPVSVIAADRYSRNFLLAVDNALIFKPDGRPQNVVEWANMLLGKTPAPELPAYMLDNPKGNGDESVETTIIMSPEHSGGTPSQRGLIDISGRRVAQSAADHTITNPSNKFVPKGALQNESALVRDSANYTSKPVYQTAAEYEKSLAPPKKSLRWPLTAAALVVIVLVGAVVIKKIPSFDVDNLPISSLSTKEQQVLKLLQEADKAMSAGRIILPEDSSAASKYLEVLGLDPNNKSALQGVDKVLNHLSRKVSDSIMNGDTVQAETLVQLMEKIAPTSKVTLAAKSHIGANEQDRISDLNITALLAEARSDFVAGRIVTPSIDNALQKYRDVLQQDPDNKAAIKGIKELVAYYKKLAQTNINRGHLKKAELNIANIEIIDPRANEIDSLRRAVNSQKELLSKEQNIDSLLEKADTAVSNGRLYSKSGSSAFAYYKEVIDLDPDNPEALKGLETIEERLEDRLDNAIKKSDLNTVEKAVATIKAVAPNSRFFRRASKKLRIFKTNLEAKKAAQVAAQPSRPGVEIAGEIMGKYKMALEKRQLKQVQDLSEFLPGRKEFIKQFLRHYKSFDVKVSRFKYIARENKASATVQLTKLIDKNGSSVTPGAWGSFGIEIKKNQLGAWRIYW